MLWARASLRMKLGRLSGLCVKARQKVPEPRNNGNAMEAKAGIKAGNGGSPRPRDVVQRGLWIQT